MKIKIPYRNHARRHLPGGSDPLPIDITTDLAQRYNGAVWDNALGDLENAGALAGSIGNDTGHPWTFDDWASGFALLQNGVTPIPAAPGSLVVGNASAVVIDAGLLTGMTGLLINPTWAPDPVGQGPYFLANPKVGSGVIRQWSVYPADPPSYDFDLISEFEVGGQALLTARLCADGSLITATNPITLDEGDSIDAFWTLFTWNWD